MQGSGKSPIQYIAEAEPILVEGPVVASHGGQWALDLLKTYLTLLTCPQVMIPCLDARLSTSTSKERARRTQQSASILGTGITPFLTPGGIIKLG